MDVNNADFKPFQKWLRKCVLRKEMYTACLSQLKDTENVRKCLVSNTECKQKLCLFGRTLHGALLSRISDCVRYDVSAAV